MKKKQLCLWMVIALLLSMLPLSSISAAAEKAIGGYATLGAYTPSADAITRKIMFAMPGAWQNSVTADERCGGYAGVYPANPVLPTSSLSTLPYTATVKQQTVLCSFSTTTLTAVRTTTHIPTRSMRWLVRLPNSPRSIIQKTT